MNSGTTTTNEIPAVARVRVALEAALYVTRAVHPHTLSAREKIALARVVSLLWEAHDTIESRDASAEGAS